MTEDEAKTKWCPFARTLRQDLEEAPTERWFGPFNRYMCEGDEDDTVSALSQGCLCIASACMAWRWKTVANPDWKPDQHQQLGMYPQRNPYAAANQAGIPSTTEGRCGLAGQP